MAYPIQKIAITTAAVPEKLSIYGPSFANTSTAEQYGMDFILWKIKMLWLKTHIH